jgi:hypothetical protein
VVRHRLQWFAIGCSGSAPIAVVRHRLQWCAAVRSGSPSFAVVRHRPPIFKNLKKRKSLTTANDY